MKKDRKRFTLPDSGLEVVMRVLRKRDLFEIVGGGKLSAKFIAGSEGYFETTEGRLEFQRYTYLALERAVISPKLVTEGVPSAREDEIHILDLSDADCDFLVHELNDFALGGARTRSFPEGAPGEPVP